MLQFLCYIQCTISVTVEFKHTGFSVVIRTMSLVQVRFVLSLCIY